MADSARGLRSAAKGAGAAAPFGTPFGPVGTAVASGIGGIGGWLYDMLGGNKHKENVPVGSQGNPVPYPNSTNQSAQNQQQGIFDRIPGRAIPNLTPEQLSLQNFNLNLARNIAEGKGGLNPIAQQAERRFRTETIPTLAERFTAAGHSNPGTSPAFAATLGQAGAGLNQDLAAQQYALYALLNNLGFRGENIYQNEMPGAGEEALNQLAQKGPSWIDQLMQYFSQNPPRQNNTSNSQFPDINTGYELGGNPLPNQTSFGQNGYQSTIPSFESLFQQGQPTYTGPYGVR